MAANREIDPRITTLVRVDKSLRNSVNPAIAFSMSPEMKTKAQELKDQLSADLGLSDRQIWGWKGLMDREGVPYWVIRNGAAHTDGTNSTNGSSPDVFLKP